MRASVQAFPIRHFQLAVYTLLMGMHRNTEVLIRFYTNEQAITLAARDTAFLTRDEIHAEQRMNDPSEQPGKEQGTFRFSIRSLMIGTAIVVGGLAITNFVTNTVFFGLGKPAASVKAASGLICYLTIVCSIWSHIKHRRVEVMLLTLAPFVLVTPLIISFYSQSYAVFQRGLSSAFWE